MTLRPSSPNAYPSGVGVYPSGPDLDSAGDVSSPTLVASQTASNATIPVTSTVNLDSAPFTPDEGELLVVKAGTSGSAVQVAAVAGGGLPWTLRDEVTPANGRAHAQLWTAVVGRGQSTRMTVSVTVFNDKRAVLGGASMVLERWSSATLAAEPNTVTVPGSSTPTGNLTDGTLGAALTWADFDYNASVVAAPSYHAGGVQTGLTADPGSLVAYYAYNIVTATNGMTFGMDAPAGQQASIVALELLPALVPAPGEPLPPEPDAPPVFVTPPGAAAPQVQVPVQRLLVADTMTGTIGWELPASTMSWADKLNDVGSLSATLVVEAALEAVYAQGARNPGNALRETLDGPNRFSYVVTYGNDATWAGPMQPSIDTPADQPTVSVGGKGIESLLDKRVIMGYTTTATGSWADPSRDVVFTQTNPAAVVYQLVRRAITSYDNAPYRGLPITCTSPPAMEGDETFTYLSYDLKSTWAAIGDLVARDDGPDVRFVPYLTNTVDGVRLTWDLQIGDPTFPGSGPVGPTGPLPWVFDDASSTVTRKMDAVGTASTYFVAGSGQDRDKLIARSTSDRLTRLGFPAMEVVSSGSNSETDINKLQSSADGLIVAHETPTETWSVAAAVDGAPPLGAVLVGDPVTADVRNHWLILPGAYTRRVTGRSGDGSGTYTLNCDPPEDEGT